MTVKIELKSTTKHMSEDTVWLFKSIVFFILVFPYSIKSIVETI